MKFLSDSPKRGLSVVVGYALLIGITISLSVLVFGWLRFYVSDVGGTETGCPEGVSVIISEASCLGGPGGYLNVTLKNKGRYNVEGFVIRVHDEPGAEQGFYSLDGEGEPLRVGESKKIRYNFSDFNDVNAKQLNTLKLVEVQSYRIQDEKTVYCSFIDITNIDCESPF